METELTVDTVSQINFSENSELPKVIICGGVEYVQCETCNAELLREKLKKYLKPQVKGTLVRYVLGHPNNHDHRSIIFVLKSNCDNTLQMTVETNEVDKMVSIWIPKAERAREHYLNARPWSILSGIAMVLCFFFSWRLSSSNPSHAFVLSYGGIVLVIVTLILLLPLLVYAYIFTQTYKKYDVEPQQPQKPRRI